VRLPRLSGLLAAAVLSAAAGCGDSGPLSHADLVKRTDAACREAIGNIEATGSARDLAELGRVGDHQVDVAREQVDRIAGLHPPDGDRAAHDRLVDALRRAIAADRRVVADAKDADLRALAVDGVAAQTARDQARSAARTLGARGCAAAPPA
jgi:predicted small lipoprotein YifL